MISQILDVNQFDPSQQ